MMKTMVMKSIQITTKNNRKKLPIYVSLAVCLLITHIVLLSVLAIASETTNTNNDTGTHTAKSHVLSGQQYQQILEKLDNGLKEKGNSGEIYFHRAFIYKKMQKYKDALSDCDAAIACNFDNARVRLLKGETLFDLKRYQEALLETNKSIALDGNKARAYALKAKISEFLQNYDQALQAISRAIELDMNNASYYEIRAQIAYKVEEYERCIQDANAAIKLDPHSSNAYTVRSLAYAAKDDRKQAKQDKIKARELAKEYKEDQF